jgi:ABC-type protease/lipase transport system fused ATPase/permease subunit
MLLYVRDGRQVAFGPKEEVLKKLRQKERPNEAVTGLAVVRG